ncbi:MAG: ABC transporter substrate-binding protein [Cyanobacteriota bacterium]|jgi:branched-chain amino acid transport system substrate-binding protein
MPIPFLPPLRSTVPVLVAAVGVLLMGASPRGEVGVGPRSILVGQSAAFSGPSGELGREFREGAHQVFDQMNAQGGIHGRQIVMVYRDDRYEPDLARRNTERFINNDKVFALFGYVGTPTVKAALPLIERHRLPLVAPLTGAQLIRQPSNPLVFNVRASYHQEIKAIVSYLHRYGRRSIAVVYQNDAYGRDGLAGAQKALAAFGLRPVVLATVERNSTATGEAARRVALARPDAVLIVSSYGTVASFITNLRRQGNQALVMNVSFVGSNALARTLPPTSRHGVGISQVVPFPWNPRVPVVRDYQNTIRRNQSQAKFGFSSLEGYIAATMLVRALEAAGPDLTRQRFLTAFDSLGTVDLGGFPVTLRPGRHQGSDFVELTFLVGRDGAFIH